METEIMNKLGKKILICILKEIKELFSSLKEECGAKKKDQRTQKAHGINISTKRKRKKPKNPQYKSWKIKFMDPFQDIEQISRKY
jgi:hypothetical protein